MTPADYNRREYRQGRLTGEHLETLVRAWQRDRGLVVDGLAGPVTRRSLDEIARGDRGVIANHGIVCWPMRALSDGRPPQVSQHFGPRGPGRGHHDGVDIVYEYLDTDPAVAVGDGGAVVVEGDRRWWVPRGTMALAAGGGRVRMAGEKKTGWRCWVDHGHGVRTGGFHLLELGVSDGCEVDAGTDLGPVGDNPAVWDPRHLHWEASPVDRYAPFDPAPLLAGARVLPAA